MLHASGLRKQFFHTPFKCDTLQVCINGVKVALQWLQTRPPYTSGINMPPCNVSLICNSVFRDSHLSPLAHRLFGLLYAGTGLLHRLCRLLLCLLLLSDRHGVWTLCFVDAIDGHVDVRLSPLLGLHNLLEGSRLEIKRAQALLFL